MSSCRSERTFLGFPHAAAAEAAERGGHAGCYRGGGGGGGAPLDLCTEGLGFESGDGRVGADEAELDEIAAAAAAGPPRTPAAAAAAGKEGRRAFPPPLRWMGEGSGAYMRAERRDGRLILREVRIERPEAVGGGGGGGSGGDGLPPWWSSRRCVTMA
ncbi:hypothetical protein ACMD2_15661 [Ananas comosus]|uniref:FAF domain-containing protein n=1 Tax=Ananas comosus TaxID=4615 RepID=A0A199UFG2_ANACO|nr:hypothetical protein ACMD2_15661 [Ananas comosus]